MRSDQLMRFALLALLCLGLSGCLLPEIDTPPLDPALASEGEGGSGGGGGGPACTPGVFKGSLNLNKSGEAQGYNGECTINGNVTVTWKIDDSPTDMLAMTKVINGRLTIKAGQDNGSKMVILPNLQTVKELIISSVPLTHAPTFPSLSNVSLQLVVENNYRMQSIPGFPKLTQVGSMRIYGMQKLTSVPTFQKLEDIGGDVIFQHVPQLKGVAFPGAGTFNGNVIFDNNTYMTSVDLGNATFVGSLTVSNQPNTTSVRALKVTKISKTLKIADNGNMTADMLNFPQLKSLSTFELRNQPKIGHLKWMGQGVAPKLHNTLIVCNSGVSYAQAKGFFEASGTSFMKGECTQN